MGNFDGGQRGGGRSFGRRDSGGGRFDRPREMTKVTCSNCGKETEVPFKPTGDRPVYCRECFEKMGGAEPRRSFNRNDSRPPFRRDENRSQGSSNNAQLDQINAKLDQLIKLLSHSQNSGQAHAEDATKEIQAPEEKKISALVTAAKKEKKEMVGKKKRVVKKVSETPTETPEE